jgi:hypothetical protein
VYFPVHLGGDPVIHTTVDASVVELSVPTVASGKVALHVLISSNQSFFYIFGAEGLSPTTNNMIFSSFPPCSSGIPTNGNPSIYIARQNPSNPTVYITPIEEG